MFGGDGYVMAWRVVVLCKNIYLQTLQVDYIKCV